MERGQYEVHKVAHESGLLGVMPDPNYGWDRIQLPLWELSSGGLSTDIYKNAARAAENTGVPQRVRDAKKGKDFIVEVHYAHRAALLNRSVSVPGWIEPTWVPLPDPEGT